MPLLFCCFTVKKEDILSFLNHVEHKEKYIKYIQYIGFKFLGTVNCAMSFQYSELMFL